MLDNRTIGDSVYEKIKYDIVHLTLKPGEKLSEASLAEKYGISKAPIRVALRKLQEDCRNGPYAHASEEQNPNLPAAQEYPYSRSN